ncbi:hypothetical protein [Halorubrum sp. T3]|uniref:hypothetical protein n=1 Tax=Halorubrum sp. T3 TaxID=1194088 RepID=UPI00178C3886|nr:hypothetical protein [Halorubrum sp. T3]
MSDEDRGEPIESSRLGLWRCSRSIRSRLFISEQLRLWRCSRSIRSRLFISEQLGESEAFAAAPLFIYKQTAGESQHAALISPLPIPSYFPPTEPF